MKYIKKVLLYMFSKPLNKRYSTEHSTQENKDKNLPDSDYDGMGNFSRFGRP